MKKKLSITIDEKVFQKIQKALKNPGFRNTSHVVEVALKKMFGDNE